MKILILISILAISCCLVASESSSTTPAITTPETSTTTEAIKDKKEEEETMKTGDEVEEDSGETTKNKRTIERTLGYGYNDISGNGRLLRQSDGKFRSYFSQVPVQQPQAYNQIRYYSTLRNSAPSDYTSRQQQVEHRPYNNVQTPSSPTPPVAAASPTFTRYQSNDVDTDAVYYTKPAYHQYRGNPASNQNAGAHLATHNAPLFTGPPAHAPAFFSGQSLSHTPFASATSHNIHPFLAAANLHANPLLYQHPGASSLALLQAPGHFGHQVIPVIILRVSNDGNSNHVFQQGGASPAYLQGGLHGLNLQTLLYPVQTPQQQQQQQPTVYSEPAQTHPGVQLVYQDVPQATKYAQGPETSSQTVQQKVSYASVSQKKPLIPTPAPQVTTQKLRKNIVVLSDSPVQQDDSSYSQYNKFSYKEKA